MIKFSKPTNLNGTELIDELNAAGIAITESPFVNASGDLYLQIAAADTKKAESIVAAHNGTIIPPEPTIADKLASVGLSIDELKTAILS